MIIDASVAFKWFVPETDSDAAAQLLGQPNLTAPFLILAEVGNAVGKRVRRGEMIATPDLRALFGRLGDVVTCVPEERVMPRAFEISLDLSHSIYDCVYLALAESRREVLVTADRKFADKAAAGGFAGLIERLGGATSEP